MSLLESQLLSKILDDNSFYSLDRYGITAEDFPALPDTYRFIEDYCKQYGNVPDYLTVTEKFEDFEYSETSNNVAYMAKTLKSNTAKRKMYKLLQEDVTDKFSEMTGVQFTNWIADKVEAIADDVNKAGKVGTNLAQNGKERHELYMQSKEQGDSKYLPTPYPTVNEKLGGGFEIGDYVTLMAFSNAGKSWISADCGRKAWEAGFGVLDYRPEINREQFMSRFDTLSGHFNNVAVKQGNLLSNEEQRYFDYLQGFNETNSVPYMLKTMEDMPEGLSVKTIEADLKMNPDIDMVIIDGFLLMDHKGNSREALSNTSRKLRQLFSRNKVCGLVVHQTNSSAEKDKLKNAEDSRVPVAPDITDYSETIAVVQDGLTVLTFAQKDGVGSLKIAKAKAPDAVGETVELHCNFNMGTITERTILNDI